LEITDDDSFSWWFKEEINFGLEQKRRYSQSWKITQTVKAINNKNW
jgi:hypothetical protein